MSRDWRLYLDDMHEACERIVRYLGDMDKAAFVADEKTYDAVLRNLEVLGEACKQLPADIRSGHPDVDWRKVAGLRSSINHPVALRAPPLLSRRGKEGGVVRISPFDLPRRPCRRQVLRSNIPRINLMECCAMTDLLEKALTEVAKLPPSEQDALAAILLAELASEQRWSGSFARSQDALAELAKEALSEHRAGLTKPL